MGQEHRDVALRNHDWGGGFLKSHNAMTIKKETAEEEALRCNQNAGVFSMQYLRGGSDWRKSL
jgi:hypothetical protein